MNQELYKQLKQFGKVKTNEPMSKHTTFKIGGPADFFITVDETDKLVDLLKYLDGEGIPHTMLGGGSNMLVIDDGFQGVVIKVRSSQFAVQGDVLVADAGCITVKMAQESIKAGLTGFEWGVGVPGTIGGAVRGNAGAMGGEMTGHVEKVEVYKDGEVSEYSHEECRFGYRDSIFKHESGVILRAHLKLEKGDPNMRGMKQAIEHLQYRNKTQPQGFASTGCIFTNVDAEKNKEQLSKHFDKDDEKVKKFLEVGKISAGWLVEQVGMKGAQIGQAQVSERHGNFVINLGGATAADVLELVEQIKDKVYNTYGIELEEEVFILS